MKQRKSSTLLIFIHIASLLIMLVIHYIILYIDHDGQVKLATQELFLDLVTEEYATEYVEGSEKVKLEQIIAQHTSLSNREYYIFLIDKDGTIHTKDNMQEVDEGKDQKKKILSELPPKVDPSYDDSNFYYDIDNEKLSGWIILPTEQQLSINLYHDSSGADTDGMNIYSWIPIFFLILNLIYSLSYFLNYKALWSKSIDYANQISNSRKSRKYNTYQALDFGSLVPSEEFLRLGHVLSRANYNLHHRQRQLDSLLLRIERLVSRAPIPIAFIQKNGCINFINERFSYVFMVSLKSKDKLNIRELIRPTDKQSKRLLDELSEQKIASSIIVEDIQTLNTYQLNITPWFSENAQVQGFTIMLNNISYINEQLTTSVQQITEQSVRLADFERLWSVIGHELRTPLSGIIGMFDLLRDSKLNNEQREIFETLEQTSQTMLFMLNDMLDFAKMDAGKLKLSIHKTDIMQLCRQVCDLMIGNARRQGIELLLFFDSNCVRTISTDEARLRQVLLNLLGNAIKFTQSGYVALKVFVDIQKNKNTTQHVLYFEVIDTGIGITEEEQSRLFSYFNQANSNISSEFGGTGLGLAISKNFAQMLGGEISLESQRDEGSIFSLRIPISQNNHKSVYQYRADLSHICLIAITSQKISQTELQKLCQHIKLPAIIKYSASIENIESINLELQKYQSENESISPVLMIDNELDTYNNLDKLMNYERTPKILLGMELKRNIKNKFINYDSYLTKPLDIDHLITELVHLTEERENNNLSKLQSSFNNFVKNLDELEEYEDFSDNSERPLILVAEDDTVNRKVVNKLLKKLGYRFISATNGKEVLEILEENGQEISLILMDCRMPIMDGLDATYQIRQKENSIPIIALTANDTDEDRENCFRVGMDNFLAKPIKRATLKAMIEKYVIK